MANFGKTPPSPCPLYEHIVAVILAARRLPPGAEAGGVVASFDRGIDRVGTIQAGGAGVSGAPGVVW